MFVADPQHAPPDQGYQFARPDDIADTGETWRAELLRYNETSESNPLGLIPAWQLYQNPTYEMLAKTYGLERLFILSAGWGLIAGSFLTPDYDITFSTGADAYKRRRKKVCYDDLCMLPDDNTTPIVFFGGKDYVSLFCKLTERNKGPRHIFYNSANPPEAHGCILKKFPTTTRTNWHYGCARAFMNNEIRI